MDDEVKKIDEEFWTARVIKKPSSLSWAIDQGGVTFAPVTVAPQSQITTCNIWDLNYANISIEFWNKRKH